MTDQDPTQRFEPPVPDSPPAADIAAGSPPAAEAPATPPAPPMPVFEPVPTTPVAQTTSARPGRNRLKWLVAGLVTLLVVGTAAGATLLLTSDSGDPVVVAWTPADSVAYAELRLDLPGAQDAELAEVMKAFPGFQDQAAFPVKLSEALDQLVGQATSGKQGYRNDIEPWFGGQIGASIGPLPGTADPSAARALVLLSVKDGAKATAWIDGLVKAEGAAAATETYNGVTITTVAPSAGSGGEVADMKAAYAVFGPVLALGDLTSVKAAIDTKGTSGLPTNTQFKEAEASVTGDRLGFAYVDTAAVAKGAVNLAGDAAAALPDLPSMLQGWMTPWAVAAIRAENGAFIIDTRSPHAKTAGPPQNAESKLPGLVPPTTVFLVEGHDAGEALARAKEALAAAPDLKDAVKQVDDLLALVGGFESVTGWIDEAGIAITRDGASVSGGLVVTPTDAAAAERLFGQITGFIGFGGASAGLSVTTEDHNGTKITLVNLGSLGSIVGEATGGAVEGPSDATIAFAVTDDVVVLGYGAEFVKGVLDAQAGQSLGDTERFSTALQQAGPKHAALLWVDVAGIRGLVESMVPDTDRVDYDANLKPYLASFDTVIGTLIPGETIDAGTLIIRVIRS